MDISGSIIEDYLPDSRPLVVVVLADTFKFLRARFFLYVVDFRIFKNFKFGFSCSALIDEYF